MDYYYYSFLLSTFQTDDLQCFDALNSCAWDRRFNIRYVFCWRMRRIKIKTNDSKLNCKHNDRITHLLAAYAFIPFRTCMVHGQWALRCSLKHTLLFFRWFHHFSFVRCVRSWEHWLPNWRKTSRTPNVQWLNTNKMWMSPFYDVLFTSNVKCNKMQFLIRTNALQTTNSDQRNEWLEII